MGLGSHARTHSSRQNQADQYNGFHFLSSWRHLTGGHPDDRVIAEQTDNYKSNLIQKIRLLFVLVELPTRTKPSCPSFNADPNKARGRHRIHKNVRTGTIELRADTACRPTLLQWLQRDGSHGGLAFSRFGEYL
jgi:hypothetical protein